MTWFEHSEEKLEFVLQRKLMTEFVEFQCEPLVIGRGWWYEIVSSWHFIHFSKHGINQLRANDAFKSTHLLLNVLFKHPYFGLFSAYYAVTLVVIDQLTVGLVRSSWESITANHSITVNQLILHFGNTIRHFETLFFA